jgi:hypothetical protein
VTLEVSRGQILAYRRSVGALDQRIPPGAASLRRAAWAGLQDSMPRAALLSIHARVEGTPPTILDDPSLVQVWGPRFSAYVVAVEDVPVFTLGRLSRVEARRRRAVDTADRLERFLAGRRMTYGEAGHGLAVDPNSLRYAATTGRVLIHWEGARQPTVWMVPPPAIEPGEARLQLARRYLHVFGPGTAVGFTTWAGIRPPGPQETFEELTAELTAVRTPIGDAWILTANEPRLRTAQVPTPTDSASGGERVRLLPSGDAYFLLQGPDRALLVPDAARRADLWTPRVWPGAVLLDGEIVGTWRRDGVDLRVQVWERLAPPQREMIEGEAAALPLPSSGAKIKIRWTE